MPSCSLLSHDWIWRAEMSPVAAVDGAIEPRDIEPIRLLKHAAIGSQVAASGVDLEIPSGLPWISTHTPTWRANCR